MRDARAGAACPAALKAGDHVGQYEILERLGAGGGGTVFKVRQGSGIYALKMMSYCCVEDAAEDDRQQQGRMRAEREFAALAAVRHPNVLRVYAYERWPELTCGYPCIVTEFVEGRNLARWREEIRPSLARILSSLARVADALAALHALGLVHRDVKAANVLMRRDDDAPILIDLGVVLHEEREAVTFQGEVVGTHTHLAPEYVVHLDSAAGLDGEPFRWTAKVDLYALGFVAYALLCGREPIALPPSIHAVLSAIKNDPVAQITEVNPAVPGDVGELIMRLLEKDPAERPERAEALRDTLEELARRHVGDESFPVPGDAPLPAMSPVVTDEADAAAVDPLDAAPEVDLGEDMAPQEQTPADGQREDVPTCIRKLREEFPLEDAAPGRSRRRLLLVGGAAAAGIVLLLVVFGGARGTAKKPENLVVRTGSVRALAPESPPPPSTASLVSSPPNPPPPLPAGDIDAAIAARYGRPTVPPREKAPVAPEVVPAVLQSSAEEGPLLRSVRLDAQPPLAPGTARKLGVPMGAHIRAKLLSNLDSRTIGAGPVEAVLPVPFIVRGRVVLPARTMLFGRASDANGRFSIRFATLRLPDDTEMSFDALALDRIDNKPGLAPAARIAAAPAAQDGLGTRIARATGNLVLNTVNGGLAQDVARNAGSAVVNHRDGAETGGGAAILLDAGVVFDAWVSKAF